MLALALPNVPAIETLCRALPVRGRFVLDGCGGHPEGRWTFLGAEPTETRSVPFGESDPLAVFDTLQTRGTAPDGSPLAVHEIPEWIGFVAYDAAWSDPRRLGLRTEARHPRRSEPVVWLGRYDRLIALDRVTQRGWVLGPTEAACRALANTIGKAQPTSAVTLGVAAPPAPAEHERAILAALSAIGRGDIYQVNLARRWKAAYGGSALALWLAMREASPVPLGMYLEPSMSGDAPSFGLVCRTMERFLHWDRAAQTLRTSPIKGTISRSDDDEIDSQTLLSDDKERAEHAMIVDLMRNDLSRLATVGSVWVVEPFRVEPFAGLHHLVSTVECETRPGLTRADVLRATFPPGSVTGTPKLRAMEIIEQLEPCARGIYTGAVGYVDRAGGLSLAVAIRTAIVGPTETHYFAGGGLVSASDVDREVAETELKARVFLDACLSVRNNSKEK